MDPPGDFSEMENVFPGNFTGEAVIERGERTPAEVIHPSKFTYHQ